PKPGESWAHPGPADRNGRAEPAAALARAAQRGRVHRTHRPRRSVGGAVADAMSQGLHAVVVTGLSGSGKSTALRVLEDLGFYCIDNLPVALLPRFLELWQSSREDIGRVALGIDVRERGFLRDVPGVFDGLR